MRNERYNLFMCTDFVVQLWPELATQIQLQSYDLVEKNAISLRFSIQSGQREGSGVDIRDLTPPLETTIVYVQSVNVDLLLSTAQNKKNPSTLARHGTFMAHDVQCSDQSAYLSLISEALDFFFGSRFGPGLHYIRQRMFLASRLSDLAPGVFVPEFSRDIHARQKLVAPLSRILAENMGTAHTECSEQPNLSKGENKGPSVTNFEEKIWNCMAHTLRLPRKSIRHGSKDSYQETDDLSTSGGLRSSARKSDTPLLIPLRNQLLQSVAVESPCHSHVKIDSSINACQSAAIPETEVMMFDTSSSGSSNSSIDLFAEDIAELDHAQYGDVELLLDSYTSDENDARLFLDTEMELCHTRGAQLTTGETDYPSNESHVLTQRFAYFNTSNYDEDPTWPQDQDPLIGQDLITHSKLYAHPSYNDCLIKPQDEVYINESPSLFSLPSILPTSFVHTESHQSAASNSNEYTLLPNSLQAALRPSPLIPRSLTIDEMATQQRQESIFRYNGRWSLSRSKACPAANDQNYDRASSSSSSTKEQADLSDHSVISPDCDEMLFDNFDFSRGSNRSSPWSTEDNEMLFEHPRPSPCNFNSGDLELEISTTEDVFLTQKVRD